MANDGKVAKRAAIQRKINYYKTAIDAYQKSLASKHTDHVANQLVKAESALTALETELADTW